MNAHAFVCSIGRRHLICGLVWGLSIVATPRAGAIMADPRRFSVAVRFAHGLALLKPGFAPEQNIPKWQHNAVSQFEEMALIKPGKEFPRKPPPEREAELKQQRRSPFDPRGEIHIPIGVANTLDTLKTFVEPEGCFSPGAGSCGVYFWLAEDDGKLTAPTFDGIVPTYGLTPEGYLIPWTEWKAGSLTLRNELCTVRRESPQGEVFVTGSRALVRNTSAEPRKVSLHVALRAMGPAGFPVKELRVSRTGDALLVEGHPALVAKQRPAGAGVLVTDTIGETLAEGRFPTEQSAVAVLGSCSGALRFDLTLQPGQAETLEFVCPVLPGRQAARHQWDNNTWFKIDQTTFNPAAGGLPQPDPGLDYYRTLSVQTLFKEARQYWSDLLGAPRLSVPDKRWAEAATAIASHLSLCLNEGQPDLAVLNLNPFTRDGAYMADTLLKLGHFDLARAYLDYMLAHPFSGRVQPEADNPGQILWTLGEYWLFTRDSKWLASVYPQVAKLAALVRYGRTTPGPHWVWDDTLEFGDALPNDRRKQLKPGACDGTHPEYTEAFDIAGLRAAAMLAKASGQSAQASEWRRLGEDLMAKYDARYSGDLGKDYGSYVVLWPARLYPLESGQGHERFKNTGMKKTGEWRYFPLATAHQGLLAGNRLSGCGTLASHLDEPQMQGWYAFDEGGPSGVGAWPKLRTTWSWNYPKPDWAKTSARAMPDGWVLAEVWLLMRDALLHEDADKLVLLGGVDPAWFKQEMTVTGLPTYFGPCSFNWKPEPDGARLTLSGKAKPPGGCVLRLPKDLDCTVRVNGKELPRSAAGDVLLPAGAKTADTAWSHP